MLKLQVTRRPFRTLQSASHVKLPFPFHAQTRVVQLCPSVPYLPGLKPFRAESITDIQGYRPNMLVGTARELQELAGQVELGTVDLSSVDYAVIALTRCGQSPISDVTRVVLWQTFGVPVYEIFVGLDNSILGYECELHEGWHIAPKIRFAELNGELLLEAPGPVMLQTALKGFVTDDKCPCGRAGSRLLEVEPVQRINWPVELAATA